MFAISKTETFMEWFNGLRDGIARGKIRMCIDRAGLGNFGDHHAVGEGVSEMRIKYGPGYRLYYTMRGQTVILLLVGGDKSSQAGDIKKAKKLNKEV